MDNPRTAIISTTLATRSSRRVILRGLCASAAAGLLVASRPGRGEAAQWSYNLLNDPVNGSPSAVSWGPGRFDVFWVDYNTQAMQHRSGDANTISSTESLGGKLVPSPSAVSWGPGRLDAFAIDAATNQVRDFWYDPATAPSFGGMGALPGSSIKVGSPVSAVSWGPGRLDVFAVDAATGQMKHWWYDRAVKGGVWSDPELLGGNVGDGISAVSWGRGRLDAFASDRVTHQVRDWWYDPATAPSFGGMGPLPQPSGNPARVFGPSATSWGPGRLDVFAGLEVGEFEVQLAHWIWG